MSSAAAAWATRLLTVPGAERVTRGLLTAVVELHIHAGWAAFDAALYDRAMHHYTHGLELATEARDAYLQAAALICAGLATEEHGHPNDGLKMLQFGQVKAMDILSDGPESATGAGARTAVEARARAYSATAFWRLGYPDAAFAELANVRQLLQPAPIDLNGDPDYVAASLELGRGRVDAAEGFVAALARRWEGSTSQRARSRVGILAATIHVRAGESNGLRLAHDAITGVGRLSSVRGRQRLAPLIAALECRPAREHRDLARMGREVAAIRS